MENLVTGYEKHDRIFQFLHSGSLTWHSKYNTFLRMAKQYARIFRVIYPGWRRDDRWEILAKQMCDEYYFDGLCWICLNVFCKDYKYWKKGVFHTLVIRNYMDKFIPIKDEEFQLILHGKFDMKSVSEKDKKLYEMWWDYVRYMLIEI